MYPKSRAEVVHKGRYFNHNYGYSVFLPSGLIGTSDPPPLPQHGFGITLSRNPSAYIWVDGSFNAADWASLDEAIDYRLDTIKEREGNSEVLSRISTRLHRLPAIRFTVRYKGPSTGEPIVEDVIIAIRKRRRDVGIVYATGLTTPESRYPKDKELLNRLLKTWRIRSG